MRPKINRGNKLLCMIPLRVLLCFNDVSKKQFESNSLFYLTTLMQSSFYQNDNNKSKIHSKIVL